MFHDDNNGDDSKGKLDVLQELRQLALNAMGDKMGGKLGGGDMKSVSVMAPDQQGLQKGLDMAKQVADKPGMSMPGHMPDDGNDSDSSMLGDDNDFDDMSPEELDQLIKELQMKKQEKLLKA